MDLFISCEHCRGRFIPARSTARFCSAKCRQYWNRARKRLPKALTERETWVKARGKRPIQVDGRPASSTDPSTWSSYRDVMASSVGDGFGIMLGDGLGCIDLDDCIGDDGEISTFALEVIAGISEPIIYVERSMSGRGLHVFVEAPEAPGVTRSGYERYTRARFIRMTGDEVDVLSLA